MAEEAAGWLDYGYDGVSGFWLSLGGEKVCDSTKICGIELYFLCVGIFFFARHVYLTGSVIPHAGWEPDSEPAKKTGWRADSAKPAPEPAPKPAAKPAAKPARGAGARTKASSVAWSGGGAAEEDSSGDEWVKMD